MTTLKDQHQAQVRDILAIWQNPPGTPFGPIVARTPLYCRDAPACRGDRFCRCRNCKPPLAVQTPSEYRATSRRRIFIGGAVYLATVFILAALAVWARFN